ncbi:hypothetical protein [Parapedobacter soli]|uniref:hypothetical protein n=1 Tax=Parapedobacter soli TaxID=416955 RepID=UPI0021CA5C01|nr:hypothetical protein [Parapedobacter soli]
MKMSNLRLGIGTGSGTLLSMAAHLGMHDMVKTAVLAAIGAAVSFAVSWVLQKGVKKKG